MAEREELGALLIPDMPPHLYLLSAFLAMEPVSSLMRLSRECGGGSVTLGVQEFVWKHCISRNAGKIHLPYLRSFVKKLIGEVEASREEVLDKLYEQYTEYIVMVKDDGLVQGESMARKSISFLFAHDLLELPSCPSSMRLVVPLQCSLNMLEGDTGCSVWPSSLLLSEFILCRSDIFSQRSCFEVGSGVGLVGICLNHVKAHKIILSDGDLSTLSNMKINLELNHIESKTELDGGTLQDLAAVSCIHLPWESAAEKKDQLQGLKLDIILAADVIYDPSCLPHLVHLLSILLNQTPASSAQHETASMKGLNPDHPTHDIYCEDTCEMQTLRKQPIAYIASVIRNEDTFNYFLKLAAEAGLGVVDVSKELRTPNLLPYMNSYERSKIHLFLVSY
uniref:FAM86 N-terminal domain-containing protein n=1 Tax=Kalanchoe fedtschenkoi TaxID=63787 RepID=A0A7N0T955_KALFE